MRKQNKIAIVIPYVIPSQASFYEEICKSSDDDVLVVLLKPKPKHRLHETIWHYPFNYLILENKGFYFKKSELALDFSFGLYAALRQYGPDIVVFDGFGAAYITGYFYCFFNSVPYVMWNSNSSIMSIKNRGRIIGAVKKIFIRPASMYYAGGTPQKSYLEFYGVEPEEIKIIPYTVNVYEKMRSVKDLRRREEIAVEREKYPCTVFIYVGMLIHRKGVDILLKAFAKSELKDAVLLVIGDGDEREALEALSKRLGIEGKVEFLGYKAPDTFDNYLALADVMVVPSRREPTGTVVVEGMASGLYTITSDMVGLAPDLIDEKFTGSVYPSGNYEHLAKLMKAAHNDIDIINKRRDEVAEWICKNWSMESAANGFIKGLAGFLHEN